MKTLPKIKTLRELLSYDPETGVLTWKVRGRKWFDDEREWRRWNSRYAGEVAGTLHHTGYLHARLEGKTWRAHRLAYAIYHGAWPTQEVDHMNGIRADNRIANLRDVSKAVNRQNRRRAQSNSEVGRQGVTRHGAKFRASISVGGRNKYLGLFTTPDLAYEVYLAAKRELHAGCTI